MENSTSNGTTSGTTSSEFTSRARVWYWVVRGLLGVIILAGNTPVIYVIVRCHRLQKAANWFILSLAFADLSVGIFLIPVSSACALWIKSCNFSVLGICFDLLLFVSIGNMCVMTADRYLFVVKPLTYQQNMTNRRVLLWMLAAWIIPIINSLISLAWIFSDESVASVRAFRIYSTLQTISFNLLPCAAMLLIYGHIFIISRRHSRRIHALTKNQRLRHTNEANSPPLRLERSATRVFGLVVLIFVLCWLLSAYRHLCDYFSLPCQVTFEVVLISRLLMIINSAINPFIYALLKEDIKQEVKKIFCGRKARTAIMNSRIPSVHSHRHRGDLSDKISVTIHEN
ncbi:probable G-protein coupled receptor No9 [Stylophora pistillata]|uniref:probable G-protein coupled receptor No9 n=1 Tax=Stylophora pistillata TaxID=50429 RepID=UPI000C03D140|nr:probable G-protein coupled receptor No9 [Stylophora pistillata]XP_022789326.1 probable G-protein coupled receptor No9 [Stylophora pistillata]XP_022789327.1 probable G-protein coupled receptor No9 [Stylophora pistillata]